MVLSALLLWPLSGCIYLAVGGIGAVGGYIVSPDTVEGLTQNDAGAVWDVAIDVLSVMGLVKEDSESSGLIIADVNEAKVTVTVVSLSQSMTKVTVKARRAFFPKISIAQDVFVKIMSSLEE
jgi:hypothetical protein